MAAPPRQPPNMDKFEAYFQKADLDRDGRISGAEAVAFFQGTGLPKNVLAQIWQYSDPKTSGFLGREQFYNALKLVTVAQSGRQLTRDIVMAALGGPASWKIPAPQIKITATSSPLGTVASKPPSNSMMPPAQIGSMPSSSLPSPGFHGATPQSLPFAGSSLPSNHPGTMRPMHTSLPMQTTSQGLTVGANMSDRTAIISSSLPMQSTQGLPRGSNMVNQRPPISASLSTDWYSGQSASLPPKPPGPAAKGSKASVISSNGISSDSVFGGDAFSATQGKMNVSSPLSSNKIPITSNVTSISMGSQTPAKTLQNLPPRVPAGSSFSFPGLPTQPQTKKDQHEVISMTSASSPLAVAGVPGGSHPQWRKMTKYDLQKYMKVFVEVDKDRDGKITGEQARNLFLSWRLPREVLKQVWDLSDQDGDSMLSLREFCIALYFMERYREGRTLPSTLPNGIMFDDALLQVPGHPSRGNGGVPWQPGPGFQQQGISGIRPATGAEILKPQQKVQNLNHVDDKMEPVQKKSAVPTLEKHLLEQLSDEEQSALNSKLKEATDAGKSVEDLEKEIMEAREKTEFYRAKMQELVLYKSRCDTKLIEVMEKSSSSKREYEILAKKYEEKCKQVGDVASKLTIEEATFREIQERKLKLYNAIVKLDSGSAGDLPKVQAEQIQSDLEDLVNSLNDRCKQYGLRTKPTTLVELPFGWQPGIQEGAADWDEDWDKFQEEGFELVKELVVDVQNIIAAPKSKSSLVSSDNRSKDEPLLANASEDSKVEKISVTREQEVEAEPKDLQNENDLERSPPSSPREKEVTIPSSPLGKGAAALGSPGKESGGILSPKFDSMSFKMDDGSPQAKDFHSEHGSIFESDKSDGKFTGPGHWPPTFDTQDDPKPTWSIPSNDKVTHESKFDNFFSGSGDFGLNPIKTGTSISAFDIGKDRSLLFADSVPSTPANDFGREKNSFFADSVPATPAYDFGGEKNSFFADSVPATPFYNSVFSPRFNDTPLTGSPSMAAEIGKERSFFADSVPGTPHFNSIFSPRFSGGGGDRGFDSLSRFDSFSSQGNLSRFDSFNNQGNMSRFDSFNVQPSLSRFDSMRSTAASENSGFFTQNESSLARFDSIRSTRDSDYGHAFSTFDDSDPFGSGPFKPLDSSNNTPKHSTDRWSAF